MRLAVIPAAALAASIAGTAAADPAQCETRIGGAPVTIFYDDAEETIYSSLRERYLTRRNNCPGGVVIAYLMPDLTAEQRKVFCASYDPASRSHSLPAQGPRDAWGQCAAPSRTCSLVNATKDEALALVGIGEGAEAGTLPARVSSAVSAVTHSSGAMILTGASGALANAISSTAASVSAAIGTQAALVGAAASIVVIGGAIYVCGD